MCQEIYVEDAEAEPARQLLDADAWLCGEDVGSDFVNVVHQIVCKPGTPVQIRVAEHAIRTSRDYQIRLFKMVQACWEITHSDWIFRDLSLEDSKKRCLLLDKQASALRGDGTSNDNWFSEATR